MLHARRKWLIFDDTWEFREFILIFDAISEVMREGKQIGC